MTWEPDGHGQTIANSSNINNDDHPGCGGQRIFLPFIVS